MTEHGTPDEEALRAEIDETRTELAATVEELAARTHVSARAKDAAGHAVQRVRDAGEAAVVGARRAAARTRRFPPLAFLGSAAASVGGWRIWRRRSR